mgnify:CR=1 FL=1
MVDCAVQALHDLGASGSLRFGPYSRMSAKGVVSRHCASSRSTIGSVFDVLHSAKVD